MAIVANFALASVAKAALANVAKAALRGVGVSGPFHPHFAWLAPLEDVRTSAAKPCKTVIVITTIINITATTTTIIISIIIIIIGYHWLMASGEGRESP